MFFCFLQFYVEKKNSSFRSDSQDLRIFLPNHGTLQYTLVAYFFGLHGATNNYQSFYNILLNHILTFLSCDSAAQMRLMGETYLDERQTMHHFSLTLVPFPPRSHWQHPCRERWRSRCPIWNYQSINNDISLVMTFFFLKMFLSGTKNMLLCGLLYSQSEGHDFKTTRGTGLQLKASTPVCRPHVNCNFLK